MTQNRFAYLRANKGAFLALIGILAALLSVFFFTLGPGAVNHREVVGRIRADEFIEANLRAGNFVTLENSDLVAAQFEDPDQPSGDQMLEVARLRVEGYDYREIREILVEKETVAQDALQKAQASGKFVWPVGSIILFLDPKLLEGSWNGTNTLSSQLQERVQYTTGGAWPASGVVKLRVESENSFNGDSGSAGGE